jgi:hypothetical protein
VQARVFSFDWQYRSFLNITKTWDARCLVNETVLGNVCRNITGCNIVDCVYYFMFTMGDFSDVNVWHS